MNQPDELLQIDLPLPGHRAGKVREVYQAQLPDGTPTTILIASDRLSAFDVVMPNGVPGKGVVLTQISRFWFDQIARQLGAAVPHHAISFDASDIPGLSDEQVAQLRGRVTIGHRARVVPIECVVRGYLAGSGWKEYQQHGTVCGQPLPAGLQQCDELPEPIFTPATKAESGHDENISFAQACDVVGQDVMERLRAMSFAVYELGRTHAAERGVILADTKFEFGYRGGGDAVDDLMLIDEVMTPDSSRFWPADEYQPGRDQPSFDKQFVRNHLQALVDSGQWDKTPPGPTLPPDVVRGTLDRYLDAYQRLTGQTLSFG